MAAKKKSRKSKSKPTEARRQPTPRKSGRRGIGPRPEPDETTAGEAENTSTEAGQEHEEGTEEEETQTAGEEPAGDAPAEKTAGKPKAQRELLKMPKQQTPAIQHGRMSAHFIGFRAHRLKNRVKVVTMRYSLELEDDHAGRIPKIIEDEWRHFKRGSVKLTQPEGIGTQNFLAASTSDGDAGLEVTANVPKAVISHVAQKGKGAIRKVTRLEIHLLTTYTADVDRFCRSNFDETVWIVLEESQATMGEEAGGE